MVMQRYRHRYDRMVCADTGDYVHFFDVKQLQAENDRLKEAFEWFRTDLKEIKTMNEPTFFTICQRWMPHIDQVLQDKDGANAGSRDAPLKENND